MGLFSGLAKLFKSSEPPKLEESSDCCVNGQCVCGEASSTENEDTPSTPLTTSGIDHTTVPEVTTTSNTSSTSGDVKPVLIKEPEKLRPATKNKVTVNTSVEETSKEKEPVQLELDLSGIEETESPVSVSTTEKPVSSSTPVSETSTRNKTRRSKAKKAKSKKKKK